MSEKMKPEGMERRRHERFPVREGAMVSLRSSANNGHRSELGFVVDISRGGLAFNCALGEEPLGCLDLLEIFGLDGSRVPIGSFKVIYEYETTHPREDVKMKRCGLEFCRLSGVQSFFLDSFIEAYAVIRP
jgi:hypothetical protein